MQIFILRVMLSMLSNHSSFSSRISNFLVSRRFSSYSCFYFFSPGIKCITVVNALYAHRPAYCNLIFKTQILILVSASKWHWNHWKYTENHHWNVARNKVLPGKKSVFSGYFQLLLRLCFCKEGLKNKQTKNKPVQWSF